MIHTGLSWVMFCDLAIPTSRSMSAYLSTTFWSLITSHVPVPIMIPGSSTCNRMYGTAAPNSLLQTQYARLLECSDHHNPCNLAASKPILHDKHTVCLVKEVLYFIPK